MNVSSLKAPPRNHANSLIVALFLFATALCGAQERPPAVPLIAHNPYFSVWSMANKLTDENTKQWAGSPQPIAGLARIDGKTYRFMGADPRGVPAMEQTGLKVTPTHTVYTFTAGGVRLTVSFFTPALPRDLDVLSRPVTYLTLSATGEGSHTVELLVDVDPIIAVNTASDWVTWGRSHVPGMTVLNEGSRGQRILDRSGDNLRVDWGYFHLGVPDGEGAKAVASNDAVHSFATTGKVPDADDMDMPAMAHAHSMMPEAAHLAVELPLGAVSATPVTRHVLLAYTEEFNIEFLGRKLRPYWQRNHMTVQQMLEEAKDQYASLERRGDAFDKELTADLEKVGGPAYAQLAILAYRQTLAAHGLSADMDGKPMLFPKENFSNGCISTVDVLYPSSPFFLFFNPRLIEAQLKPVLEYAALPRWKWPFAPHDLGTYPLADGQVYGGGEVSEVNQMPVEESGNMLIMAAAMANEIGNWDFIRQYWPQFTQWAEYLRAKGLDPANQLSTDDFAGHLAHNANLSIKAIEGLDAYALMARGLGKNDVAEDYARTAKEMAAKWQTMDIDGDHYKLAFDKPGTWSQKYNLVWDRILGFDLFPAKVRQTEVAFYLKHLNKFGLPLDSRKSYTKLDWELWTATLVNGPVGNDADPFATFMTRIGNWVNEGPSRVPLTDWYDTISGKQMAFQARSVVGGVYIKMLADKTLAKKWRTNTF